MEDRDLPVLEEAIGEIWETARRLGLDPFPTHFEIVPATILYEFGAYLLPGRFSHWTHGKAYHSMKSSYDYGLSKIYELVINANPSYAFLLETNSLLQNKFVVAHVFGHTDFFKHNIWFAPTNRQMLETVSQNAERIRSTASRKEAWRSSVSWTPCSPSRTTSIPSPGGRRRRPSGSGPRVRSPYADLFRREETDARKEKAKPGAARRGRCRLRRRRTCSSSCWSTRITWRTGSVTSSPSCGRRSLYFVPQMQTKIMNEGWASYWHMRIMRELDLTDEEFVEFGKLHSAVCTPGKTRINPYYVGLKIFEDIEKRFGREQDLRGARDGERCLLPALLPHRRAVQGSGPVRLRAAG